MIIKIIGVVVQAERFGHSKPHVDRCKAEQKIATPKSPKNHKGRVHIVCKLKANAGLIETSMVSSAIKPARVDSTHSHMR